MTHPPGPPYGAPQQGQPGGQPQWWQNPGQPSGPPPWQPQQQWDPAPPPPSRGGGKTKWILAGLAVLAVIVLTAVVTVLVVRSGDDSDGAPGISGSDWASANDTGPITIITDEPTCGAWNKAVDEYHQIASSVKFDDRDENAPLAHGRQTSATSTRPLEMH